MPDDLMAQAVFELKEIASQIAENNKINTIAAMAAHIFGDGICCSKASAVAAAVVLYNDAVKWVRHGHADG